MSFFADPIGNISGGIHDLGKSTLGRMAETAALVYFMGPAGLDLAAPGALLEGASTAGLAGLAGGATSLLNGGSLMDSIKSGAMAYGAGSLMGGESGIDAENGPAARGGAPVVDKSTLGELAKAEAANTSVLPQNVAQYGVNNFGQIPNAGLNPNFAGPDYTNIMPTATPLPAPIESSLIQAPTSDYLGGFSGTVPTAQSAFGSNIGSSISNVPSIYANQAIANTTPTSWMQTAKNWAVANPWSAGAAGVAGLAALKAAAKPNTVAKLPDNRKIKYYGGNPYSGASFLRETPAVAATGGLVALAEGGIAHFDDGGNVNSTYSPDVINNYIAQNNLSGAALTAAEQQFGVTPAQVAYAQAQTAPAASTPAPLGIQALDKSMGAATPAQAGQIAINNAANNASAPAYTSYTPDQISQYVQQSGINLNDPAAIAAAERASNIDPAAYNAWFASNANPYSAAALSNPSLANVNAFDATLGSKAANMDINNAIATAYKNTGATENLAGNIQGNTQLAREMDTWNVPPAQMAKTVGKSEAEIQALYDAVNPNGKYASKTSTTTKSTTTGTATPATTSTVGTTTQNGTALPTYTPPGSTTPVVLNPTQHTTTNVTTPTDIATAPASALAVGVGGNNALINPNGTISQPAVSASAPGMQTIRDAYTRKGGSLGYVNPAAKPVTTDAATQHYLDILSGKAPATKTPWTPNGVIASPYYNSVMGMPLNPKYEVTQPGNVHYDPAFSASADYTGDAQTGLKQSTLDFFKAAGVKDPSVDTKTLDKAVATSDAAASSDGAPADFDSAAYLSAHPDVAAEVASGKLSSAYQHYLLYGANGSKLQDPSYAYTKKAAGGGLMSLAAGGLGNLGGYSDGGRLLRGPGDGISDSIPATIGSGNPQPARLADGEFVVPARIVSEIGNGSTEAGARKLYQMMDRVQNARKKTVGKQQVAANPRAEQYLPA